MNEVQETTPHTPPETTPAEPVPAGMPEPDEVTLPDKPPVPEVEEDTTVPGEEPVPDSEFLSPEEAEAHDEVDNTESDVETQEKYDGGPIPTEGSPTE